MIINMVKYLVFVCITCFISSCGSEQKNSDITPTVARPAKLLTITPKLIGNYLNYHSITKYLIIKL